MGDKINGVHPLLVDLVIDKTLKHLSLHHLKACRQVCKGWGRIATEIIRKKGCKCKSIESNEELEGFIKCIKKSTDIPFDTFEFRAPSLFLMKNDILFDICGPSMKSMTIKYENSSGDVGLREKISIEKLMDILINKAKNLVHLTLGVAIKETQHTTKKCLKIISPNVAFVDPVSSYNSGVHLKFPDIPNLLSFKLYTECFDGDYRYCNYNEHFLEDLFRSLTSLKTLDLSSNPMCYHNEESDCNSKRITVVLEALHAAERDATVTAIKVADMTSKVVDCLIKISDVGRLKLIKLGNGQNFAECTKLAPGRKWTTLFAKQSQLEEFSLFPHAQIPERINPWDMKSLKFLELGSFRMVEEPFRVAEMIPSLETLIIFEMSSAFFSHNETAPSTTVTSLEIKQNVHLSSMKRITVAFPSLKHLNITVFVGQTNENFEDLASVWEFFPGLESLTMKVNCMSPRMTSVSKFEAAICGVPVNKIRQWNQEKPWSKGKWVALAGNLQTQSIANLQGLKKLDFKIYWSESDPPRVQKSLSTVVFDTLFYAVITSMPNLHEVLLQYVNISDHGRERILEDSKIVRWKSVATDTSTVIT